MKKLIPLLALVICGLVMVGATGPTPPTQFGTGSIAGVVTDSATGQPIAGVKVSAGCCNRYFAYTGNDGSYVIQNLPAGTYPVRAMMTGYAMKTYPTPVPVEEGQQVTGINFALVAAGGGSGSISGTVYDKLTNQPIAGAKVTAGCCGRCAYTAENGTYTIANLPDGSYSVKAMKSGYYCATWPTPVVIQNGQPVTGVDFYLMPCNSRTAE